MGDAVTLSELVGFSYSLCELIYPNTMPYVWKLNGL